MEAYRESLRSLTTAGAYPSCDGLRALAVIWVCFHHTIVVLEKYGLKGWWVNALGQNGQAGVDVFLVLSGFLLGKSLFREIDARAPVDSASSSSDGSGGSDGSADVCATLLPIRSWFRFYARRWFRIVPAFVSLIIFSIYANRNDPASTSADVCRHNWWRNMLFINNYGDTFADTCVGHTWSIALEVQLYLLSPPLFALAAMLCRKFNRWLKPAPVVFGLFGCVFVGCVVARAVYSLSFADCVYRSLCDSPDANLVVVAHHLYTLIQYRSAPYACGGMASMVVHLMAKDPQRARSCSTIVATAMATCLSYTVVVLVCIFGTTPFDLTTKSDLGKLYAAEFPALWIIHLAIGRPVFGAAVAFLLVRAVTDRAPLLNGVLAVAVFRPIAGLSYSMYLFQYFGWSLFFLPFCASVFSAFPTPPWWGHIGIALASGVLVVFGVLPMALANYVCVERPAMEFGTQLMKTYDGSRALLLKQEAVEGVADPEIGSLPDPAGRSNGA